MELVVLFIICALLFFGPRKGGRMPGPLARGLGALFLLWFLVAMASDRCGITSEDMRIDALLRRDPLRTWGRGRTTLLGDAAHPVLPHTGQGAAQALEDAVALGRARTADGRSVRRCVCTNPSAVAAPGDLSHWGRGSRG
jgi:hypothetical protein